MNRAGRGIVATLVCLLLVTGVYAAALRFTVDLTRTDLGRSPETRDLAYLGIHSGIALLAILLGFVTGRSIARLGFAYATLLLILSLTMMASVQIATFSLACEGHNDLLRHWTC
ncbi:MAG: hypothetical protein ACE5EF_09395 [Dehalococcoidia bacterium]